MITITELIRSYEILVQGIDDRAQHNEDRAYGGIVRAGKGLLVESIAKHIVEIAWNEIGGHSARLTFSHERVKVPLKAEYLARVHPKEVADYIKSHIGQYFSGQKVDVHVHIDNRFVLGIECKAYTENAMIKRILVDFTLLRQAAPNLKCVLLQLESQLTGDYSQPSKKVVYGSTSTHTLLSYFDIDLSIITLLEGERKVDEPIHKADFQKGLSEEALKRAITTLKELLKDFIKAM